MRFPTGTEVARLRSSERNFSQLYLGVQRGKERGDCSSGTLMVGHHYRLRAVVDGYDADEHLLYFGSVDLNGSDIRPNMTLLCGTRDDPSAYGSVRIRAIGLGAGPGGNDGLYLEPNDLRTNGYLQSGDNIWIDGVYRLYRKLPYIVTGTVYEDGNSDTALVAGGIPGYGIGYNANYLDRPVALMGSPRFAWAGEEFDFYGWRSHGRGGRSIQNWTWDFDGGVCIGPGIGFPGSPGHPVHARWDSAGEYIASLVVEDDSGNNANDDYGVPYDRHRAVRPVLVYDRPGEGDTPPYTEFEVESLTGKYGSGWSCRITVFGTADKTEFPDNALIIVYAEDWYGDQRGSIGGWYGQEGILFCGYIRTDSVVADFEKSTVSFEAQTIEQWMKEIGVWPMNCVSDAAATWHHFNNMTVEDVLWYLTEMRSNLKDITDCFFASDVGAEKTLGFVDLTEASLYNQMSEQLGSCFFGKLSASRHGSVHLAKHKNMLDQGERMWWGPPVYSFGKQDWRDEIQIGEERQRDSVAQADFIGFVYDTNGNPLEVYSLAPARQTNFGGIEKVSGVLLSGNSIANGQDENNTLAGLYLAWKNIRFPHIAVPTRVNNRVLEPSTQDYFAVVLVADDTERGYIWAGKEFLTTGVSVKIDNENGIIYTDIEGEASTWGPDGVAGLYPAGPPYDDPPSDNPSEYWPTWPPPVGFPPDGEGGGDPPPWYEEEAPAGGGGHSMLFWPLDEEDGEPRAACLGSHDLSQSNACTRIEGKIGYATHFERASSQRLSAADHIDLSVGDGSDFTIACWVWLDSKPGASSHLPIVNKNELGLGGEFYLMYQSNWGARPDRFFLSVLTTPTTTAVANTFGAPSIATWYFIVAWFDASAVEVGISINNGAADTFANLAATPVVASVSDWEVGRWVTQYFDGRIDALGWWKRLLTADERTYLWNGGDGRELCL